MSKQRQHAIIDASVCSSCCLFNRFAQSARPGCFRFWVCRSRHGVEKTLRKRIPNYSKRCSNKNEIDTELFGTGARRQQINEKIVPKGSQKEAKRDKKSKQRLQDDLGPSRRPISRLSPRDMGPIWSTNSTNNCKKQHTNNCFC